MSKPPAAREERLVSADGTGLRLVHWEADAPRARLLVIHGLGEHAGRYAEVGRYFAERSVSVAAPDLRGHGRSQGRRGWAEDLDRLEGDVGAAWERLGELPDGPRFVLGHSLGGLLVLRFLRDEARGAAGALVSAPWLATALPIPAWKRWGARVLDRLLPWAPVQEPVRPEWLSRDPERIRDRAEDPLVHAVVTPRLFLRVREAQRELLQDPRLAVPALFLVPGADRVADGLETVRFARALEDADLDVLPDVPHEPFQDRERHAILGRCEDWLVRHLRRD